MAEVAPPPPPGALWEDNPHASPRQHAPAGASAAPPPPSHQWAEAPRAAASSPEAPPLAPVTPPRGAARIRSAFRAHDVQATGIVKREVVAKTFKRLGSKLPTDEVVSRFTEPRTGGFNYEDFLEWLYLPPTPPSPGSPPPKDAATTSAATASPAVAAPPPPPAAPGPGSPRQDADSKARPPAGKLPPLPAPEPPKPADLQPGDAAAPVPPPPPSVSPPALNFAASIEPGDDQVPTPQIATCSPGGSDASEQEGVVRRGSGGSKPGREQREDEAPEALIRAASKLVEEVESREALSAAAEKAEEEEEEEEDEGAAEEEAPLPPSVLTDDLKADKAPAPEAPPAAKMEDRSPAPPLPPPASDYQAPELAAAVDAAAAAVAGPAAAAATSADGVEGEPEVVGALEVPWAPALSESAAGDVRPSPEDIAELSAMAPFAPALADAEEDEEAMRALLEAPAPHDVLPPRWSLFGSSKAAPPPPPTEGELEDGMLAPAVDRVGSGWSGTGMLPVAPAPPLKDVPPPPETTLQVLVHAPPETDAAKEERDAWDGEARVLTWEVVAEGGVNVREAPDREAPLVGDGKDEGELVRGSLVVGNRNWLRLEGEPGFIAVAAGKKEFLRRKESARVPKQAPTEVVVQAPVGGCDDPDPEPVKLSAAPTRMRVTVEEPKVSPRSTAHHPTGVMNDMESLAVTRGSIKDDSDSVFTTPTPVDTDKELTYAIFVLMVMVLLLGVVFVVLGANYANSADVQCPARPSAVQSCRPCSGAGTVFLPIFGEWERTWGDNVRVFLYFVGLLWAFQGVAIACDHLLAGCEAITDATSIVWEELRPNVFLKRRQKIWNKTVARLTLLALGSAAPELMISMIETGSRGMFSGEIGPSTVVGCASFKLLTVTGFCVCALPYGTTRKIADMGVFAVNTALSFIAYAWLAIILKGSSPDCIELWEALVTLALFPVVVVVGYLADTGVIRVDIGTTLDEVHERHFADAWNEPEDGAPAEADKGNGADEDHKSAAAGRFAPQEAFTFGFEHTEHEVREEEGKVSLKVTASGVPVGGARLRYYTCDASATAGSRYEHAEGVLVFDEGGPLSKMIHVNIIDDNIWHPKLSFTVHLSQERTQATSTPAGSPSTSPRRGAKPALRIEPGIATVAVIDKDVPGTLSFEVDEVWARYDKRLRLRVLRAESSRGRLTCQFETEGGTATASRHFRPVKDTLHFEDGDLEKFVEVDVMESRGNPRADDVFKLKLQHASAGVKFPDNKDYAVCTVHVDTGYRPTLAQRITGSMEPGLVAQLWANQLHSALFCNGSPEEQAVAGILDWVVHCPAVLWRVACALIPPPGVAGGWPCLLVGLFAVAITTILVADLASLLACATNQITGDLIGVTIVAMGLSMPDMFASRRLAKRDQDEDAGDAVGRVTGINAVNLIVGLGVPYTVGALYWQSKGVTATWRQRAWRGTAYEDLYLGRYPGGGFIVPSAAVFGFGITMYIVAAFLGLAGLTARRVVYGGELGGPRWAQLTDSVLLTLLWVCFLGAVITSSLADSRKVAFSLT